MQNNEHQELSAHTQTRTLRSPIDPHDGHHTSTNKTNTQLNPLYKTSTLQIQHMRLKQDSRRELQACYREIQLLKDQLYNKNQQIQEIQNQLLKLKQQLNNSQREVIKHYRNSEKYERQLQKLRIDNENMEIQIQKCGKERKIYYGKLEQIKQIQNIAKREIFQKDKICRNYVQQNRILEKQLQSAKYEISQLNEQLRKKDYKIVQSDSQYRSVLQKNFMIQNQLRSLQHRGQDNEQILGRLHDKIAQLQNQKQELQDRLKQYEHEQEDSRGFRSYSNNEQVPMLQIQSLITQIHNLMGEKNKQKEKIRAKASKFHASIACLEQTLKK